MAHQGRRLQGRTNRSSSPPSTSQHRISTTGQRQFTPFKKSHRPKMSGKEGTPSSSMPSCAANILSFSIEGWLRRGDWTNWKMLTDASAIRCSSSVTILFLSPRQVFSSKLRHPDTGHRQLDPRQVKPDRLGSRNASTPWTGPGPERLPAVLINRSLANLRSERCHHRPTSRPPPMPARLKPFSLSLHDRVANTIHCSASNSSFGKNAV